MNILLTGAGGFIGSHLYKELNSEHKVFRVFYPSGYIEGQNSFSVNLTNIAAVNKLIKDLSKQQKIDAIIHLAFINGTKNFYSMPSKIIDIGIRGLLNVYDAAKYFGIKNLFIASSGEVYQKPSIVPTPEDVPLIIPDVTNPRYSYGGTKILYELMGQHYKREEFDRVILFRPHNVYGSDMGNDHVIPELINKIKII